MAEDCFRPNAGINDADKARPINGFEGGRANCFEGHALSYYGGRRVRVRRYFGRDCDAHPPFNGRGFRIRGMAILGGARGVGRRRYLSTSAGRLSSTPTER